MIVILLRPTTFSFDIIDIAASFTMIYIRSEKIIVSTYWYASIIIIDTGAVGLSVTYLFHKRGLQCLLFQSKISLDNSSGAMNMRLS